MAPSGCCMAECSKHCTIIFHLFPSAPSRSTLHRRSALLREQLLSSLKEKRRALYRSVLAPVRRKPFEVIDRKNDTLVQVLLMEKDKVVLPTNIYLFE